MAIFFRCHCGQDLRVDEERAGGRTECPACCEIVPVPSLPEANHLLGIMPLPLLELPARHAQPARPAPACAALPGPVPVPPTGRALDFDPTPAPVYPLAVDLTLDSSQQWYATERREAERLFARARLELDERRRQAPGWRREIHWFECLLYPFRAWPVLIILALAWATLSAVLMALLPAVQDGVTLAGWLLLLGFPVLLLSYTAAFYRCVLASADAGEAGLVRWPGVDCLQVLRTGAACLVCFLAGPVIPAVAAFIFWLNSGDFMLVDQLILLELGLAAVGYWMLGLLAVDETGHLRASSPAGVSRLARSLGWRGWLMVTLIAVGMLVHCRLALGAAETMHRNPGGWLALLWWDFWGMAWVVFLLRWFGLSRFRALEQRKRGGQPSLATNAPPSRCAYTTF
jgi:hypothetical protein